MARPLGMTGYEINTDVSLVNPDWDAFPEQHEGRYGLVIAYFKSIVKGRAYDNEAMRLRVGPRGFYAQAKRFPAAFYGDTVRPEIRFVEEDEARSLTWEAVALYRAGEAQAMSAVYSESDPADVFFGYRLEPRHRYELGGIRSSMPLHLRAMIDADEGSPLLDASQGVWIYQRTSDGRHLILTAPGRRQPYIGMDRLVE